jgi:exonuclease III
MYTSYNPSTSPFYLAYPPFEETRVCFYVNKRLHPGKWSVTNHSKDAQTITIEIADPMRRVIQVHNIYNPSPPSYSSTAQGTLATLRKCLQEQANDHIVIGDFNLHHPHWGGLARPTQHAAADILLDIAQESSLILATPCGTTTWRERGSESTIDLAFISQSLENELLKCRLRRDIAQSSDHLPVEVLIRI